MREVKELIYVKHQILLSEFRLNIDNKILCVWPILTVLLLIFQHIGMNKIKSMRASYTFGIIADVDCFGNLKHVHKISKRLTTGYLSKSDS
jgi:hypothetical protein